MASLEKIVSNVGKTLLAGAAFAYVSMVNPAAVTQPYQPVMQSSYAQPAPPGQLKVLPPDKYNPRGPEVSEQNFKETLKKEGLVWVMYEYTGAGEIPLETEYGEKFWRVLKKEFGDQVDAHIRINVNSWSNNGQKAIDEIKRNVFPSFILYMNGKIISSNENDVRIRGPPKTQERIQYCLDYIRTNSPLK
jgi:hypothetical protein